MFIIDAKNVHYRILNEKVRSAIDEGEKDIKILNVNGQRYICAGITRDVRVEIHGVPGGDLGAFMSGPYIKVFGDAQDGVGNTMNGGKIVIHGMAGDVVGYGMRGGKIYILRDCGYRAGIHMKGYKDMIPVIVVGGSAGDFFCEYMAGGRAIILGMFGMKKGVLSGDYLATGMHGGIIYLRGEINKRFLGKEVEISPLNEEDNIFLTQILKDFSREFDLHFEEIINAPFTKLVPISHRPYGKIYTPDTPSISP